MPADLPSWAEKLDVTSTQESARSIAIVELEEAPRMTVRIGRDPLKAANLAVAGVRPAQLECRIGVSGSTAVGSTSRSNAFNLACTSANLLSPARLFNSRGSSVMS